MIDSIQLHYVLVVAGSIGALILAVILFLLAMSAYRAVSEWLFMRQMERLIKDAKVKRKPDIAYPTDEQIRHWDAVGDELKRQRDSRRPPTDSEPTMPGAA